MKQMEHNLITSLNDSIMGKETIIKVNFKVLKHEKKYIFFSIINVSKIIPVQGKSECEKSFLTYL